MGNNTLYNQIGNEYNVTRKADPTIAGRLLQLLNPQYHQTYLDIGCGTGNYTAWFAEKGFRFYGVEPSDTMLQEACRKTTKVTWQKGGAEQIPAAHDYFHGAIATLTIHHWQNLSAACTELSRVLVRGAKLVIFTSTPEQMEHYWLNHYFPAMMRDSIQQMPSLRSVTHAAERAGFRVSCVEPYHVQADLEDKFLYVGKHDPTLYFDHMIRKGISSFSALANKAEVEHGLAILRDDIDSGIFESIRQKYESDTGDYLFAVFENNGV